MSDNYTDDDFDSNDEGEGSIANLRKAANRAKKLENELNSLKREVAFAKAGINPDDPKMRYFIKGYEGEMEADQIKAAAAEAGFIEIEQPSESGPQLNVEGQQRVMAASAGAMPEDVSEQAALARMESAMEEGGIEALLEVARQYGIPTAIEQ